MCGQWKRVRNRDGSQNFYGGCSHNRGDDHLAGDRTKGYDHVIDVCDECCNTECKRIAAERAA